MNRVAMIVSVWGCLVAGTREAVTDERSWPTFCHVVDPELLAGVSPPYAVRTEGGMTWCEGILRKPIAVSPLVVLSVKAGPRAHALEPGKPAKLVWCDP